MPVQSSLEAASGKKIPSLYPLLVISMYSLNDHIGDKHFKFTSLYPIIRYICVISKLDCILKVALHAYFLDACKKSAFCPSAHAV